MTTLEEKLNTANAYVSEGKYEDAIIFYKKSISDTSIIEEKIDIINIIGRLYLNLAQPNKAIEIFEDSMQLHESLDKEKAKLLAPNKAAVLNNLGLLYVKGDPKSAISKHEKALEIFLNISKEDENKYKVHLANTYFSLADAYYKKKDFFFSRKHFKNAITTYKDLSKTEPEKYKGMIASAHYYLGNIYNDDNSVHDAKMHFMNSKLMYVELSQENPEIYRPFLAAVLNNLGVVTKTMLNYDESANFYLESLEEYKQLVEENKQAFYPYLAATYNSLGILFNEMEKRELAIEHYEGAIAIYNELSDKEPEAFTHYLATALHNIAILYDEKSDSKKALELYGQALSIRKLLAKKQPNEFDADVCVTELNLVTLYQSLIEKEVDMKFKAMAEELLVDIEERIVKYSSEHPTIESMKSDLEYYKVYFKELTFEYIEVLDLMGKVDNFTKEINSTIKTDEKLVFQEKIIVLLNDKLKSYPDNERLVEEFFAANVDLSWIVLRTGDFKRANSIIDTWLEEVENSPALLINRAHILLLEGEFDKALSIYNDLKDKKGVDNLAYSVSILKDFDMLKRDGRNVDDINKMVKELKKL